MKFTVKQARQYAGLTQENVAKSLKIDRTTYLKYEKRPDVMPAGKAMEFSLLVGISLNDIIFLT